MKKPTLFLITAALLTLTPALAQSTTQGKVGNDVVQNYNIDTLTSRPGEILISKNSLTLIDMPDDVEQVSSARPEYFELTPPTGNQIILRALKDAGEADLVVKLVNGQTALFKLKLITSSNANTRRYSVTFPSTPVQPAEAQAPNPTIDPQKTVNGQKVNGLITSKQNTQTVKTPSQAPDWLPFRTTASFDSEDNTLAISYNFSNNGPNAILIDKAQLTVKDGTQSLNFILSRKENIGSRITAGSKEFGTIVIPNAPAGKRLELTWNIIEAYTGAMYQYTRFINVPTPVTPAANHSTTPSATASPAVTTSTPEGTNNEGTTPPNK